MWLCVTPERVEKTERIMRALEQGGVGKVITGEPPRGEPFVTWGHRFLSERIVPRAVADGTEWWLVDNGYYLPAKGEATGYYAVTLRGTAPGMLPEPDLTRNPIAFKPWRKAGGHVLIALPGPHYGRMLGIDINRWAGNIERRVSQFTDRPIIVRRKDARRPLALDLKGAHCLVTHSSKVAVDAVIAGVPAIVEPTSPAARVCSTSLVDIESPKMGERRHWWASLMCQQFTIAEMRSGLAAHWMDLIKEEADAACEIPQGLRLEAAPLCDASIQG